MKKTPRELRAERASLIEKAESLVEAAEAENRDFTADESGEYDGLISQAESLEIRAKRLENTGQLVNSLENRGAPVFNRTSSGDSEIRAMAHYFRTGDSGGVAHMRGESDPALGRGPTVKVDLPMRQARAWAMEKRAVVDSTMNITTAADGGSAVPTGFSGEVARRQVEVRLTERLGCRRVPGKGTTVNFPFENADPQVFATTSEQADDLSTNDYERDAMVLGNKPFTLVKKTKKVQLTEELMDDEDAELMDTVADWIGRAIGITHNAALITEAGANGSTLKTYASATAIAAGEPEDIVFGDTIGYYLDDGTPAAWVTRPSTFGNIASLTGNARLYAETPGGSFAREILGYPTFYSNQVAATAASAKDLYFGNWFHMGFREDPALRLIVDPYSEDGVTVLKYSFRIVYGVLIAGALGFGVHPSA